LIIKISIEVINSMLAHFSSTGHIVNKKQSLIPISREREYFTVCIQDWMKNNWLLHFMTAVNWFVAW